MRSSFGVKATRRRLHRLTSLVICSRGTPLSLYSTVDLCRLQLCFCVVDPDFRRGFGGGGRRRDQAAPCHCHVPAVRGEKSRRGLGARRQAHGLPRENTYYIRRDNSPLGPRSRGRLTWRVARGCPSRPTRGARFARAPSSGQRCSDSGTCRSRAQRQSPRGGSRTSTSCCRRGGPAHEAGRCSLPAGGRAEGGWSAATRRR